ncbi:hypothetical protein C1N81_04975 (plasmid) [Streptomyces sp. SGAir0957]
MSHAESRQLDEAVADVVTCFDAYTRIRAARNHVLDVSRRTGRDEERAFKELGQAVARLRRASPGD